MITDEQLAELERLSGDATPGPWQVVMVEGPPQRGVWPCVDATGAPVFDSGPLEHGYAYVCTSAQVQLLAAARNALPVLVAEVRQLREKVAGMEEAFLNGRSAWRQAGRQEGAEEMRERAAHALMSYVIEATSNGSTTYLRMDPIAADIRALPLPGEE